MRTAAVVTGIAAMFIVLCPPQANGQVQVGISATDRGLQSFYLAIGEYYRVPEREVVVIRGRHIPDEEIPVVFFISQRAHVEPALIMNMRTRGQSWMDISLHFGLGSEVYYVPAREVSGPPYGKAYGYYKNKPRNKWKAIRLSDGDIVNFVNLRFVTEHYGYDPPAVMRMRGEGKSFVVINDEVKTRSHGRGKDYKGEGKGRGQGKGKGKHKGGKGD